MTNSSNAVSRPSVQAHRIRATVGPWSAGSVALAKDLGRIYQRGGSWQVVICHEGERYRIQRALIGTHWTQITTRELADMVLGSIRAEVAKHGNVEQAVAPFLSRPTHATLVSTKLQAWIARERERCAAGDISPTTLREFERYVKGDFAYWNGEHAFAVDFAKLENWRIALSQRGLSPKTAQNVMGAFRLVLRWLKRRGDLKTVPEFPSIPTSDYAPTIITREAQDAVIDMIPWEIRGLFLAMAHTLRPGEARAIELRDFKDGDLIVRRSCKGRMPDAEVRSAKERNVRVVGCDERLLAWIEWRMKRISSAEKLRGRVRLFINPAARDPELRWGHDASAYVWAKACKAVGVDARMYEGTKHSTSTDLLRRGERIEVVQKFLGHKDVRSTERYAVLADRTVSDAMKRRP